MSESGFYNEEAEYTQELIGVVEEKLQFYEQFHSMSLSVRSAYDGSVWELKQQEKQRLLQERFSETECSDYERIQHKIRGKTWLLTKKAENSVSRGTVIPLEYLFRIFRADDFLKHCVYLTLAPEIDRRFSKLYSLFAENDGLEYPCLDFCIHIYTVKVEKREQLIREYYQKLEQFELFFSQSNSKGDSGLNRELRLDARMLNFILQADSEDPELRLFSRIAYGKELEHQPMVIREWMAERLSQLVSDRQRTTGVYYIYGAAGTGKKFLIHHTHHKLNQLCLMADAGGLVGANGLRNLNRLIREAMIRRAGLCIWNFEKFYEEGDFRVISTLNRILDKLLRVYVLSSEKWPYEKSGIAGSMLEVELPLPDLGERAELWREAFRQRGLTPELDVETLSAKFSFTPAQIVNSVRDACEMADWQKSTVDEEMIYLACRKQVSHHMGERAALIKASYHWDDLVLPEVQKQVLKHACNQIEYYHLVYEKWGFKKKMAYGRGVSMLFCGPPGTGKTMGAQVIANALHLELYKVDLSSVMSKYIGETEKNLGSIFEEVKKSQSILFFDEADSLFGKRTEVKDAHDRYANSGTSYLLQKIEEYEGIIILATNYLQNFDEAFKRRIKFIIEFSLPDAERRLLIWKKVYPEEAPLGADIDFEYLARQFELSGSSIKNIAVAAAFLAASEQKSIQMEHILYCLCEESQKSGKRIQREELGEYYYLMK